MSKPLEDETLVCIESYVCEVDGADRFVQAGEIVSADDPAVSRRSDAYVPVGTPHAERRQILSERWDQIRAAHEGVA